VHALYKFRLHHRNDVDSVLLLLNNVTVDCASKFLSVVLSPLQGVSTVKQRSPCY
jgi:hypothetical protein